MARDHRLRERRLKLGASQFLVGCMAGYPPRNAQSTVSNVERSKVNNTSTQRVRSAIVWIELEPRRRRREARIEEQLAEATEAAILLGRREFIVERMTDLLYDGRAEDFDALAVRVDPELVRVAGDQYLDGIRPVVKQSEET